MQDEKVLYKCIASTSTKFQGVYTRLPEDEWKKGYDDCTKSFQNKHYKNETSLSSCV